ncbi:MAG TPA: outer membrane protein assembly factor BamA [Thermoanaerobaculia bacterium]|nr:outer membrane protein assembly factor BamA [Thermoanaerobaculia bacterium]
MRTALFLALAGLGALLAGATQARAQGEAPPSASPAPSPSNTGPIVKAIEIRSDTPIDPKEDLLSLLSIEVGQPLSDLAIRRTLANLQASGAIAHAAIYSRPADGTPANPESPEVVAIVALWASVQVESVRLEGKLGVKEADLRGQVVQREAEPLSEGAVLRGVYRLEDALIKEGFLTPRVIVRVALPNSRTAKVVYQIDAGPRTAVAAIDFEGTLGPWKPEELRAQLRTRIGEPYRADTLDDDVERLQRWLAKGLYGRARLGVPRVETAAAPTTPGTPGSTASPATPGAPGSPGASGIAPPAATEAPRVRVIFPVEVGPKIEVRITGAELAKLKKKGLLPFLGDTGYDEALVLSSVAKLKDDYQRQGHYHVKIDHEEKPEGDRFVILLNVEPGPVYTLRRLELSGNSTFPDKTLEEFTAVSARRLLAIGSGRLIESELAQDVKNLRAYYLLQGFPEVQVGPPQVAEEGLDLTVKIPIREGKREQIGAVTFSGFDPDHLNPERLSPPLKLADGPYHPQIVDAALERLRAEYSAAGFSEARVSAESTWNADHSQVGLVISALEGPRITVDRIIVRGNRRTDSEVIRRTLGLKPGDPASDAKLLEVERTLYKLNIFSRVEVELVRSALDDTTRDVLVRVQEGKPITLTYGIGYDSDDGLRGLLGFNHANVGGQAYALRSDLRLSSTSSRFRLLFDQPYVFHLAKPLTTSLFYEQGQAAQKAFELTRYGARTETTDSVGRHGRYSLGLDYRVVEVDKLATGVALSDLERDARPVQLANFFPSFLYDRRDDPVLPSRGYSSLAQLQYSFPLLGAQGDFLKVFLQQTQLFPFKGGKSGRQMVLAASLRAGGIEAFRELASADETTDLASRNIFISERFFSGGSTTHRAFGRDELGIPDQTLILPEGKSSFVPIGGNGLLLANLELRFPLAGALGGVVFADSGNVWADWRDIDLSQVRTGVGVGLRYLSPIGPLRIDFGWKLDREREEKKGVQVSFTFGNPF